MSDYIRNLLKTAVRQIITVIARRNEAGEVDEITTDSEIAREFVIVYNDEVRRARRERDALKEGVRGE